jgi:hypothetical protein
MEPAPPSTEPQLSPITPPSNNKRKIIIIGLGLAFSWLMIVITLIVWATTSNKPTPVKENTLSPTPVLDITKWKTYTNITGGYSLKYPSDLYMNCPIQGENNLFLYDGKEGIDECYAGEGPTAFYVQMLNKPKDYQENSYENCYSVKQEKTIVDGVEGTKYTNIIKETADKQCDFVNGLSKDEVHISLKEKSKYYEIFYLKDSDDGLKEKILSTFKFEPASIIPTPTPFVISKESLVGIWHGCSMMPSGWCNHYNFYTSGKYSYYPSNSCSESRIISENGFWTYQDNVIKLEARQEIISVGGNLETQPSCYYSDATEKIKTLTTPIKKELKVTDIQYPIVSGNYTLNQEDVFSDGIFLNTVPFWKFGDDPTSYGESYEFPEPTGF